MKNHIISRILATLALVALVAFWGPAATVWADDHGDKKVEHAGHDHDKAKKDGNGECSDKCKKSECKTVKCADTKCEKSKCDDSECKAAKCDDAKCKAAKCDDSECKAAKCDDASEGKDSECEDKEECKVDRVSNLITAAEHLERAGFADEAREYLERAEEMRRLDDNADGHSEALERHVDELREAVEKLRHEMNEIREHLEQRGDDGRRDNRGKRQRDRSGRR
ncbi:MAG: hypothetical protein ACI9R3_000848 [Verrucomicrobiales bacterium]|jgi:hypothetical protein